MRLPLLMLLLAAAVGLGLLWRWQAGRELPPASASMPASQPAARPNPVGPNAFAARGERAAPRLDAALTPVSSALPPKAPAEDGAAAKSSEQIAFELHQQFESASSPDARALSVRTAMNDELEHALASDSRLEMVECRKTICRAALSFPSLDQSNTALQKVLRNMDGPFGTFAMNVTYETAPDGSLKTTLFLSLG